MEKWIMKTLKYPKLVMFAVLIITVLFFKVMKDNSEMETNLDKYMPEKHPAFIYSNEAEDWFNIKDGIIIAIENPNGIYETETIQKVKDLTKRLQKMKEIEKADVTSLYTADNIVGTDDGMDVKAFFKRVPNTEDKLLSLRDRVKANEMIYGKLVSLDEKVTVIIARIGDDVFSQKFYQELLDLAKEFEGGDEKVYIAGRPIVE